MASTSLRPVWTRVARFRGSCAAGSAAGPVANPSTRAAVASYIRLANLEKPGKGGNSKELAQSGATLTAQLTTEWSSFRSADVVQVVGAAGKSRHKHPPLLQAAATHVLRGMSAYPLFAICNIVNAFARLDYHQRQLMDAVAAHMAEPARCSQLSPTDIACLVFAYAQLSHRAGSLLEACAKQLQEKYMQVPGPNVASILNSYSRLNECNPDLFQALAKSIVQTRPESFEPHHLSLIMNAMARCNIRKSQTMHLLANYLDGRVHLLGPQNVTNVIHAMAKLDCYDHKLFSSLLERLLSEDLGQYKLYELANVVHGLAKLQCGGPKIYKALFAECLRRDKWESRSVTQVLDAMRRKQDCPEEALLLLFMRYLLQHLKEFNVHQLTQASWCLVELDALELASKMPPELLSAEEGETAAMCTMRLVLERMEELTLKQPLNPTQSCYVQQLVRAYHYKHELDYGLQPHRVRTFCRSIFDVPTSVTSSVARAPRRASGF